MRVTLIRPVTTTYDNHGSHWSTRTGTEAAHATEQDIANAADNGQRIDEWHVTDPTGRPMRVVRAADPGFLDTIITFV